VPDSSPAHNCLPLVEYARLVTLAPAKSSVVVKWKHKETTKMSPFVEEKLVTTSVVLVLYILIVPWQATANSLKKNKRNMYNNNTQQSTYSAVTVENCIITSMSNPPYPRVHAEVSRYLLHTHASTHMVK